MKKLKALFSILLAVLSLVAQANLPCKNGPCPSGILNCRHLPDAVVGEGDVGSSVGVIDVEQLARGGVVGVCRRYPSCPRPAGEFAVKFTLF